MRFDFNKKHTTIALYAFFVLAGAIIFNAIITNFDIVMGYFGIALRLISPFIWGFCIAYLLNPLMKTIERLCNKIDKKETLGRKRRIISVIAAYLIALTCIVLFVYVISPQIKDSIVTLTRNIQIWAPEFASYIQTLIKDTQFSEFIGQRFNSLIESTGNWLLQYSTDSISSILGGVKNVTSMVSNLVLGIIISIYMLAGKERFSSQLKKLLAVCLKAHRAEKIINIFSDANKVFSGFLIGKILDSIIMGILCTLGMSILRLPFAALIGFVVGVTNIIPYFGACFGGIVGVLIILVVSPIKALWFGIFILVLQQIDGNIIGPKILSSSTGISAFWVIFAIVIGGGLFGIAGMLLGVPAFALIYAFARSYINRKMEEKG